MYDFATSSERVLTKAGNEDGGQQWAPDGNNNGGYINGYALDVFYTEELFDDDAA